MISRKFSLQKLLLQQRSKVITILFGKLCLTVLQQKISPGTLCLQNSKNFLLSFFKTITFEAYLLQYEVSFDFGSVASTANISLCFHHFENKHEIAILNLLKCKYIYMCVCACVAWLLKYL